MHRDFQVRHQAAAHETGVVLLYFNTDACWPTSSKLALITVSSILWQCVLYIIIKVETCRGERSTRKGCISTCYCCPWYFNFQLIYSLLRDAIHLTLPHPTRPHWDSFSLGDARRPARSPESVYQNTDFWYGNTGCTVLTLCPMKTVGSGRMKWHIIHAFFFYPAFSTASGT